MPERLPGPDARMVATSARGYGPAVLELRRPAGRERPLVSTAGFMDRMRAVARDCGYAIAVHGSQERDLDLIAAPWTPEAVSADHLVTRLCEEVGLVEHAQPAFMMSNPEPKPWGRHAWSLAGCPEHQYIDLSVMPRAGEPVPLVVVHPPSS